MWVIQESQAWYEVDRLVKHSWKGRSQPNGQRQLHYMVLFKGFLDAYNVWCPVTLLSAQGCDAPIARYQLFKLLEGQNINFIFSMTIRHEK